MQERAFHLQENEVCCSVLGTPRLSIYLEMEEKAWKEYLICKKLQMENTYKVI